MKESARDFVRPGISVFLAFLKFSFLLFVMILHPEWLEAQGTSSSAIANNASLSISGKDNVVVVRTADVLSIDDNLSISLWFKAPTGRNSLEKFFSRGHWETNYSFSIGLTADNLVSIAFCADGHAGSAGKLDLYYSQKAVPLDRWNHLLTTFESGLVKFYLNGELQGLRKIIGRAGQQYKIYNGAKELLIGKEGLGNKYPRYFKGELDEVSMWSKVLNQDEVLEIFNKGVPPMQLRRHSAADSLLAWWSFDEASTAVDAESSSTEPTVVVPVADDGPAEDEGTVDALKAVINRALTFDGINDVIRVSSPKSILSVADNITISLWLKTAGTNGQLQRFFSRGHGMYAYSFALGLDGGNFINLGFSPTGNVTGSGIYNSYRSSTPIPLNQWNHLLVTFRSGQVVYYLNGQREAIARTTNRAGNSYTLYRGAAHLEIGKEALGPVYPRYFKGELDEISMWSTVLDERQALELYNDGVAPVNLYKTSAAESLLAWWSFDDLLGDGNVLDSVSGANAQMHGFGSEALVAGIPRPVPAPTVVAVPHHEGNHMHVHTVEEQSSTQHVSLEVFPKGGHEEHEGHEDCDIDDYDDSSNSVEDLSRAFKPAERCDAVFTRIVEPRDSFWSGYHHVSSDFHIHAFSHYLQSDNVKVLTKDKIGAQGSSPAGYLEHISQRSSAGGHRCRFHSFSEHVGWSQYNFSWAMGPDAPSIINTLDTAINANKEGHERDCSFFSAGWEVTPANKGHMLVMFPGYHNFVLEKKKNEKGRKITKGALKGFHFANFGAQRVFSEDASSALFALAHPFNKGSKSLYSLSDVNTVHKQRSILSGRYSIDASNRSHVKSKLVAIEFPRRFERNGKIRGHSKFVRSLKVGETLYRGMLFTGFQLMPMINGDQHSVERKIDMPDLTVMGPRGSEKANYSSDGYTAILSDGLGVGSFYQSVSSRLAYITYKKDLKLLATASNGALMGSAVDFSKVDFIAVQVSDAGHALDTSNYDVEAVYGLFDGSEATPGNLQVNKKTMVQSLDCVASPSYSTCTLRNLRNLGGQEQVRFVYFRVVPKQDSTGFNFARECLDYGDEQLPIALSSAFVWKKPQDGSDPEPNPEPTPGSTTEPTPLPTPEPSPDPTPDFNQEIRENVDRTREFVASLKRSVESLKGEVLGIEGMLTGIQGLLEQARLVVSVAQKENSSKKPDKNKVELELRKAVAPLNNAIATYAVVKAKLHPSADSHLLSARVQGLVDSLKGAGRTKIDTAKQSLNRAISATSLKVYLRMLDKLKRVSKNGSNNDDIDTVLVKLQKAKDLAMAYERAGKIGELNGKLVSLSKQLSDAISTKKKLLKLRDAIKAVKDNVANFNKNKLKEIKGKLNAAVQEGDHSLVIIDSRLSKALSELPQ